MSVGPVRYEIIDPLRTVRFQLEPNDVQPISFDLVLSGVTPPFFEERNLTRHKRTGRVQVDVIRYHQGGWVVPHGHRGRGYLRGASGRSGSGSGTTRGGCA